MAGAISSSCSSHPRGVRGLKSVVVLHHPVDGVRTPRGVRGLKLHLSHQRLEARDASHPSRGAWIEIRDVRSGFHI